MGELYISAEQKERLSSLLLSIPSMRRTEVRELYASEVQARLNRALSIGAYEDPRHAIWALVTACTVDDQALHAMYRVVSHFNADDPVMPDLTRLVRELERPPLLTVEQRAVLVRAVSDAHYHSVRDAFHNSIGPSHGRDGEPDWRVPSEVIHRAEMACQRSGGLALILTFAESLAHGGNENLIGDVLHEWIASTGLHGGVDAAVLAGICPHGNRPSGYSGQHGDYPGELPSRYETPASDLGRGAADPLTDGPDPPGDDPVRAMSTRYPVALAGLTPIRGNLPIRNTDFTGRGELLRRLRAALVNRSVASVVPQALHGLGGVGKTQLAIEYIYRYMEHYELIWWIAAEQATTVRSSLAELGRELEIPASEDMHQTATSVLNALATSTRRWLLVYDNADRPADLAELLPPTGGHVVITSRNADWKTRVEDAIEVDVLERTESVELIQRKVSDITEEEADRLAEKVGDLPLALEQAAAWQSVTGMAVDRYLELFDAHVAELMAENKPANYPASVSAFLSVAFDRLRASTVPEAPQLLELFAYLGPEPVAASLLRAGRNPQISEPLINALSNEITLNRAIRELGRHGLARVLPKGQRLQVHRLVQAVLREGLKEHRRARSLVNVRTILATANPGAPDNPENWRMHAALGPHIATADLIGAGEDGRRVVLDQVRYLFRIGDYAASADLAERMVQRWSRTVEDGGLGPDHEHTLLANRHLAIAVRSNGQYKRAREINQRTFNAFRSSPQFGDEHEHTVGVGLSVGYDLRLAGLFKDAIASDRENLDRAERTYRGVLEPDVLAAKNNVGVGLRMLGRFEDAYVLDTELVEQFQASVGDNDARTMYAISNVARDLYGLGRYAEALVMQQDALPTAERLLGPDHHDVLQANRTVAIALRKSGQFGGALSQARDTYQTYQTRFGPSHEHTLAITMTFANALRTVGQFAEARSFAQEGVEHYVKVFGEEHPLTLAAQVNLGIVLRALRRLDEARELEERTYRKMIDVLGANHPHTLCAGGNLSNSLVLHRELDAAFRLSQEVAELSRAVRGENHPYSVGCDLNAALDLRSRDESQGHEMLRRAVIRFEEVLGPDHPETLHAGQERRADFDIEPPLM